LNENITSSSFYSKFKENNENNMTAHAICFDFCYQPQPCQIWQNGFFIEFFQSRSSAAYFYDDNKFYLKFKNFQSIDITALANKC
jgi:hypothetical protein